MSAQTRPSIWRPAVGSSASLALVIALAVAFASMRALGMLGPARLRWLLPLSFVLMTVMPWVLLSREGRRRIGIARPSRNKGFVLAISLGALAAAIYFSLGMALFGTGPDNWFISVATNYRNTIDTTGFSAARLHFFFTIPALLFSPIGEEIFFRGLLQRALEERLSRGLSTLIECAAFGIVHLCHHGIVRTAAGLTLLPVSGGLWILLMFLVALLFAWLTKRSGSLYPAMASHASFNLAMNVAIFSLLWQSTA